MFTNNEVYQIYDHISAMAGNPDPVEGCRMIVDFCKKEKGKLDSMRLTEQPCPYFEPEYFCKLKAGIKTKD